MAFRCFVVLTAILTMSRTLFAVRMKSADDEKKGTDVQSTENVGVQAVTEGGKKGTSVHSIEHVGVQAVIEGGKKDRGVQSIENVGASVVSVGKPDPHVREEAMKTYIYARKTRDTWKALSVLSQEPYIEIQSPSIARKKLKGHDAVKEYLDTRPPIYEAIAYIKAPSLNGNSGEIAFGVDLGVARWASKRFHLKAVFSFDSDDKIASIIVTA